MAEKGAMRSAKLTQYTLHSVIPRSSAPDSPAKRQGGSHQIFEPEFLG